jgi:hypothetical protein
LGSSKNQEKTQKSVGEKEKAKSSYENHTSGDDHHLSIQNKKDSMK